MVVVCTNATRGGPYGPSHVAVIRDASFQNGKVCGSVHTWSRDYYGTVGLAECLAPESLQYVLLPHPTVSGDDGYSSPPACPGDVK